MAHLALLQVDHLTMNALLRLPFWLIGALLLNFWILLIAPVVALKLAGGWNYTISSNSMSPTLAPGNHVLALPVTGKKGLQRGSVHIFRHPNRDVDYVKRLIGLPGETVELIGGVVHIDGKPLVRRRMDDHILISEHGLRMSDTDCSLTTDQQYSCSIPQFTETLTDGRGYPVFDMGTTSVDNWGPVKVPDDAVFMLGDNRDNSVDSRFSTVGMVPVENLKYRAWMFYISTTNPIESLSKLFHLVEPV